MPYDALVYADTGIEVLSVSHTASLLTSFGFRVKRVTAEELVSKDSFSNAHLFVMPGGADRFYFSKLKGEANRRIVDFVRNGGTYLGICAGAYYAGARIEFALGEPLEIVAERELRFFPGCIKGPAFKGFAYNSQLGARPASLISPWLKNRCSIYCNGGGYFIGAETFHAIEVVARFEELTSTPAAIITCKIGEGKALLSSVHFEYDPAHLEMLELQAILPTLQAYTGARNDLLTLIKRYLCSD